MGNSCSLPYSDFNTNFSEPTHPPDSTSRDHFLKQISFGLTTDRNYMTPTQCEENFDIDEEGPLSGITDFTAKSKLVHYLEDTQLSFLEEDKFEEESVKNSSKQPTLLEFPEAPLRTIVSYFIRHNTIQQQLSKGDSQSSGLDLWDMGDIRLNHLIDKSELEYLWEAENIVLNKQCAVRIILTEVSDLQHYDYSATTEILENLMRCRDPDLMEVYSFALWQTHEHLVIVIVQEPVHCRLLDYFNEKVRKAEVFSELEIFQIMGDIYHRLEAYKNEGFTVPDATFENVFLSKGSYKIKLSEIDLALPLINASKISQKDKRAQFQKQTTQFLFESEDSNVLSSDEDLSLKIIATLAFKLMVKRKDTNFSVHAVERNKELQKSYKHLFYLLSLRGDQKNFLETLLNLYRYHKFKDQSRVAEKAPHIDQKREDSEAVESLLDKDSSYTYIGNHVAAKAVCLEAEQLLAVKKGKGVREYFQLMKCFNRLLAHCIELKELDFVEKLSMKLTELVKSDRLFYQIIANHPAEYYDYIFNQARAFEARGNKSKAKRLYVQALCSCENLSIAPRGYVSAINAISKLVLEEKDEGQALKYYDILRRYYARKSGFYLEKAIVYSKTGDILANQQTYGTAVKHYANCLEMLRKTEIPQNELYLETLDKIIDGYAQLKDNELAISHLFERSELKAKVYGRQSHEYKNDIKEICQMFVTIEDYKSALKNYMILKKLTQNLDGNTSEKYLRVLLDLSEIYIQLGKYKDALGLLEEYKEIKKQNHELSDLKMFMLSDKIANVLFKQGVYKQALDIQFQHLHIKRKIFGEESKYYLVSLNNIGDTYFMMQDYECALSYHTECFRLFKGELSWRFAQDRRKVLLNIAYDYQKLKNHAKAFEFLYENLVISKNHDPSNLNIEVIAEEFEALESFKKKDLLSLNFADVMIETKVSY